MGGLEKCDGEYEGLKDEIVKLELSMVDLIWIKILWICNQCRIDSVWKRNALRPFDGNGCSFSGECITCIKWDYINLYFYLRNKVLIS